MSGPDPAQEWLATKVAAAVTADVANLNARSEQALAAGVTGVMTYLSTPPPAGTKAREEWERQCDECGRVTASNEGTVTLKAAYQHWALPLELVVAAMLCRDCAVALGIDLQEIPTEREHTHQEALAVIDGLRTELGSAFGIVMPEQMETMKFAVDDWERRKKGERQ